MLRVQSIYLTCSIPGKRSDPYRYWVCSDFEECYNVNLIFVILRPRDKFKGDVAVV